MNCPRCGVHYSGHGAQTRCPFCGHSPEAAEASSPEASPDGVSRDEAGRSPRSQGERVAPDRGDGGREAPPRESAPRGRAPSPDSDQTRTELSSEELWSPGSVVAGKYEVICRLGAGGFGNVFKVRHIFRKKYYALKTPHGEFVRDEVFQRRFEREIEAMERFVHPDAVMIRDSGMTDDGRPYYTMDFIDGESLKAVLAREGRLAADRAVRIVLRILQVLEVAHAHEIIHRDIKPDNILVSSSGERETVKVLDFGVAKLLDLVGETASVTRGDRVGTPKYMSPEQITGEPVDGRSDIFSIGIVFYELVTGQHPFAQVRDPIRITGAILNRDPTPPRDIIPELPKGLNDAILSMLEKKVKRRPASVTALLRQLEPLARGATHAGPSPPLELYPGARRGKAVPLALIEETSAGQRRCFLIFEDRITFGRARASERPEGFHLLLRCLPCRSRVQDAENWEKNLTISKLVGAMYPEGSAFVIEPAAAGGHGISIAGIRSLKTSRLQSNRFALSLGSRALDLDGYRHGSAKGEAPLDLSFLEDGRPPGIEPPLLAGYGNAACHIDSVALLRTNNWPLHEYYLVYRILRIGSSVGATLRLRGRGVEGVHAAVVYEAGESFLLAFAEGVQVSLGARDGGVLAESPLDLPPGMLLPLRPGIQLQIGECSLLVERAVEDHFKST